MGDDSRPFRYTRRSLSIETRGRWVYLAMFLRFLTWGLRRLKPIAYHPIALAGIAVTITLCAVSPWLLLALILATPAWVREWPDTYLRHVHPRCLSFLAGFRYRHRPRKKLRACSILREHDPVPTISTVTKIGCTTRVRIKMCDGHNIDWWQEDATRIAQTYNALDCKITQYRRETLVPRRHEIVTKPRWLELEFLTKDPFTKTVGPEYIEHFRTNDLLHAASAMNRDGSPYYDQDGHILAVAETGGGKTNKIRAWAVASHPAIMAGLREWWQTDLKGGVGGQQIAHLCARSCYGKQLLPDGTPDQTSRFDPRIVRDFVRSIVDEMDRREAVLVRDGDSEWIAGVHGPELWWVIDELLTLESAYMDPYRAEIRSYRELILEKGRGLGIKVRACVQDPRKRKLEDRDKFNERQAGRLYEKARVNEVLGDMAWERGAKCDDPRMLPGEFYVFREGDPMPVDTRDPWIPSSYVKALSKAPNSKLWPPPKPAMPAGMPFGGDPPELEGEPAMSGGRLTDL